MEVHERTRRRRRTEARSGHSGGGGGAAAVTIGAGSEAGIQGGTEAAAASRTDNAE